MKGNLVELVHDPLGLELVMTGKIRGETVRFDDWEQREVGSIAALKYNFQFRILPSRRRPATGTHCASAWSYSRRNNWTARIERRQMSDLTNEKRRLDLDAGLLSLRNKCDHCLPGRRSDHVSLARLFKAGTIRASIPVAERRLSLPIGINRRSATEMTM